MQVYVVALPDDMMTPAGCQPQTPCFGQMRSCNGMWTDNEATTDVGQMVATSRQVLHLQCTYAAKCRMQHNICRHMSVRRRHTVPKVGPRRLGTRASAVPQITTAIHTRTVVLQCSGGEVNWQHKSGYLAVHSP